MNNTICIWLSQRRSIAHILYLEAEPPISGSQVEPGNELKTWERVETRPYKFNRCFYAYLLSPLKRTLAISPEIAQRISGRA